MWFIGCDQGCTLNASEFKFRFSSVVFESFLAIERLESIGLVQIETLEQKVVLVSGHINSRVTALDWYGCLLVWDIERAGDECGNSYVQASNWLWTGGFR